MYLGYWHYYVKCQYKFITYQHNWVACWHNLSCMYLTEDVTWHWPLQSTERHLNFFLIFVDVGFWKKRIWGNMSWRCLLLFALQVETYMCALWLPVGLWMCKCIHISVLLNMADWKPSVLCVLFTINSLKEGKRSKRTPKARIKEN